MKLIRLLAKLLGLAAALAGVLAAVALLPAVQTWVAQSALARQPGLKGTLASVSAGFGEADILDLRLEFGGAVLTVPKLRAKLPVTAAVLRRGLALRSVAAKGWTLDLRHWSAPAPASPESGSPLAGAPAAAPRAREGPPAALAAASALHGILSGWRLPAGWSLDGVALEGDVLLPAPAGGEPETMHVVLKGGGLSEGREGTFLVDAGGELAVPGQGETSVSAHGAFTVAMRSASSAGRIGVKADVSVKHGAAEEELEVAAEVAAGSATDEGYRVEVGRGGRRIASVEASLSGDAQRISGTWRIDLRDADLGAFASGRPLPSFSVSGDGRFDADAWFQRVHAQGSLAGMAGRLGALAPVLEGLGDVAFDARFDGAHSGHSLRLASLRVSLGGARPAAVAQSLQGFDIDEGTGAVSLADPAADWLDVRVPGVPMAWVSAVCGPLTVTGGDATGELTVRAARSGFSVVTKTPVTAAGVSVRGPGGTLAKGLDLSLSPLAQFGRHPWQLKLSPLEVDCGGRHIARIEASASEGPGDARTIALKGSWTADLEAAAAQNAAPAFPWIRGRSASGEFSATLGKAPEVEASVTAVGRDPGRTLTASVKAATEADGSVSLLVPVKIASGKEATELSAEGSWYGWSAEAGGAVTVSGGTVSLEQLRLLGGPLGAVGAVMGPPQPAAAAGGPARAPFWGSWTGRVAFSFDALRAGEHEFSDVGGTLDIEPGAVRLEGGRGGINHHNQTKVEGSVGFDASAALPYQVKATSASATDVDAAALFPGPSGRGALIEGRFSVAGVITGSGTGLDDLAARSEARFRLSSTTGIIRLFQTSVAESIPEAATPVSDTLDTVGSAVGSFFGHRGDSPSSGRNPVSKNAEAVMSFTNEVSEIGCDQVTVDAVRGGDGTVRLAAIEATSRDEHIRGSGTIAYAAGVPLFGEPLSVDLQFGARGRVADLLAKAGLLSGRKDEQGYSLLAGPLHLAGTLDHVDTGQWHQMLVDAATRKPAAGK